jgi:uncharacterized membrane protein
MNQRTFNSALLLGVTTGLRSMMAPALLSLSAQQPGADRHWLLASPKTARWLTTMAAGELVFDKLPFVPNRISPASLSARLLIGAMCGAAVSRDDEAGGALLGIAGALVSSFAGYWIRKGVDRVSGIPDALVGLMEDGVAIGTGLAATSTRREEAESVVRRPRSRVA